MDLISVIMPVFNGEKYLRQSIESIINQSFKNLELIIVDDGSTDNSLEIIKGYDDKRIRVLTQPNAGPLLARKKGIEISTGNYIAIMDADDVAYKSRFQEQIKFLNKNPDIHFVGSNFIVIDSEGRRVYRSNVTQNYESITKLIYLGSPFCHSTMLFRRDVFEKYNYENEIPLAEDYNLWFKLLKEYKGENLPDYLLFYRVHDQNVSKLRTELLYKSTRNVLEREFNLIGVSDAFRYQIHYDLFWTPLNTSYSYNNLKKFKKWSDYLVILLKLEKSKDVRLIQFYLFLRCFYSSNIFSGLIFFIQSGYFNPLYFRYGFFFDNLIYKLRIKW